jgi:hypothetical protein
MLNLVLETVLVSVQDRCTVLRQKYHRLRNHFGRTRWLVLLGDEAQVEAHFGLFQYSVNLDAR